MTAPRQHLSIRLSPDGLHALDDLALQHHLDRSEIIRRAIALGLDPLRAQLARQDSSPTLRL